MSITFLHSDLSARVAAVCLLSQLLPIAARAGWVVAGKRHAPGLVSRIG
jgi:hypothetical protein